mgnify:CR=1 FL=1
MIQEEKTVIYDESIPKVIFIPNDVNILHEYSQTIEDILKKIDEMEDVVIKNWKQRTNKLL